jgi:LmbE family N-acetylglucosaminyl deacetylase
MIELGVGTLREVAVLGAHCDDIAIGAGGSLLTLCGMNPGVRVSALVLTGGGGAREVEERSALTELCPGAILDVTVLDLPDGLMPVNWERAREAVRELRARSEPTVVFGPTAHDAHQDHRELARLVPTAFRDHLVLGYEIVKWDGDLAQPSVFHPLSDQVATAKSELLHRHYTSQRDRDWFDRETFLGLARLRGVQCRNRYAEAFFVDKATLSFERKFTCG